MNRRRNRPTAYRPLVVPGVMLVSAAGPWFFVRARRARSGRNGRSQGGVEKGEHAEVARLREAGGKNRQSPSSVQWWHRPTRDGCRMTCRVDLVPTLKGSSRAREKWFLLTLHGSDDEINLDTDTRIF